MYGVLSGIVYINVQASTIVGCRSGSYDEDQNITIQ